MSQIFVYITHKDGVVGDVAEELLAAAKKINSNAVVSAIVMGYGKELNLVCEEISPYYDEIWKFERDSLIYPNAEIIRKIIVDTVPSNSIFLIPHCTFGMDLAPGLSIKFKSAYISDVVEFVNVNETEFKVIRQEFGGMVSTHVSCNVENGVVISLRPGCFQLKEEEKNFHGVAKVIDNSSKIKDLPEGRTFIEVVEAEKGEVDITKADVLVSVGRGIEDEENIELATELADAMGGAVVSCSRPIVDAKWMDKSRQVGTSGQTVKPKVYIACGISGSFQHMGGLKGSPFIIAINKNIKAPIFQVADVGVEADILDFIPELTEAINSL